MKLNISPKVGAKLADVLRQTAKLVEVGISTAELNAYAEKLIKNYGGVPSFINYGPKKNPFPAGLCVSINNEVVHGIPSKKRILNNGDIVGLDIGMIYKNFFTDHAITVGVGIISGEAQKLINVTKQSLENAISVMKPGNTIGDIGFASQTTAEKAGFSIVKDLVGHGVGYAVHEDPSVPGYGKRGTGLKLEQGMVLAVEPMLNAGSYQVFFGKRWLDC